MSKYQRSRILVDPKVQWAIAGRIVGHWLLFLVCLVSVGGMVRVMASAGAQSFGESWKAALIAQVPILGVMFFMLPVFLRDTLKMSNRFAGPMYRLRTSLSALSEHGTTRPIKFRDGDFWQEAAGDFNVVLDQMEALRTENAALKTKLQEANQGSVSV
jgi:hypothetical protein